MKYYTMSCLYFHKGESVSLFLYGVHKADKGSVHKFYNGDINGEFIT